MTARPADTVALVMSGWCRWPSTTGNSHTYCSAAVCACDCGHETKENS